MPRSGQLARMTRRFAEEGVRWDAARTEAGVQGMARKQARRMAARVVAVAVAGFAVVVAAKARTAAEEPAAVVAAVVATTATTTAAEEERLSGTGTGTGTGTGAGTSTGTGTGTGTVAGAEAAADTEADTEVRRVKVKRGKRRFAGKVAVDAGEVTIIGYGAEFSVARGGDATEVWAHRGKVQVTWRGELLTMEAGQHRRFGGDRVEELLRDADALRRAGDARAAVPLLREVVATDDPRAPAAAFTLGRVLLGEGEAKEAAQAFAKARALAPDGPLAEDALAREVEAWARAGQKARARDQARYYLERYSDGARVEAVRRHAD